MEFFVEGASQEPKKESPAKSMEMPLSLVDEDFLKKISNIPDKMAFKIGEVAEILGVKQYVLRYWETEFEELSTKKSGNNQRMYTRKNVETALLIQKLLHRDRFSIVGARKILKNSKHELKRKNEYKQITTDLFQVQRDLKRLLQDIQQIQKMFA